MVRSFFIPQYGQEFFRPERGIFCRWLQEKQIWDYKPGSHLPELPTGIFSLVREKGEELRPRHIADASVHLISTIVQPGEASAQDGALFQGQLQGAAQAGS